MEVLRVLLEVIFPVAAVAVIGGLAARQYRFQLETMQQATFYLFSPALVFTGLASVDVAASAVARVAVVVLAVFAVNAAVSLGWSALRGHTPRERASMVIAATIPNQGNLGLPMSRLAFGAAGLEVGTLLFVIGIVMGSTAGVAVGTYALGRHGTRRELLLAPFRYPAAYAAIAGLLVNTSGVRLPVIVEEPMTSLGQAAIPMMLVVLGMSFRMPRRGDLTDPFGASVNRLVVGPAVAWLVATAVGLDGTLRSVTVLMSAMPAAVNTTILAAQLRADTGLGVRVVVLSTLLSGITLAGLITLL